ncbi:hypothetical protein [Parasphingorhabdus sp.]|uniref:hypothetical protein n=1 Tax=Parasphingorhabdus sp. TaxID=2709688 RepID=UPI003266FDB1
MRRLFKPFMLTTAGIGALALSLPVMGQDAPESLLPPGFGDPAPAPAPAPTPVAPPPVASPAPAPGPAPAQPAANRPISGNIGAESGNSIGLPSSLIDADGETNLSELDDLLQPQYYLSPSQRRTMDQIGVLSPKTGGVAPDAFGEEGGQYLTNLISNLNGPILSRWSAILLRRTLLSKLNSPDNVNPADWVAERAWRLLLIGEADAARSLVLKVDGGNYTPRLYEVAMQAHLATADPAGICPLVPGGDRVSDVPTWTMFGPICASFSGEQSRATVLLRQARRAQAATGIDYLLAEKTVGAGFEGRRAVTIKWDDIEYFNNWRFGLGAATGVEPPDRLYMQAGRHVQGWRSRAPMLSIDSRMKASSTAAAIGVLSNSAIVDLYSAAYDSPDVSDDWKAQASTLRRSYTGENSAERVDAMRALWNRSDGALASYSSRILTARAAAKIPASDALQDDSADLIASMLSAGLDRNAALWMPQVSPGSEGWALLMVGTPADNLSASYADLDEFGDNDESIDQLKSKLLLAALAGLGRVDQQALDEFSGDLELDLDRVSKWSRAIASAARRKQAGTVALLTAVGMQGRDWNAMSPVHMFHITRSLQSVGMEPEARMIAAEALSRI